MNPLHQSRVSHGDIRRQLAGAVAAHLLLAALMVLGNRLWADPPALGLKGGGGGPAIGIGLVGELPAGRDLFKPPVRPVEPPPAAAVAPPAAPPARPDPPRPDDFVPPTAAPAPAKPSPAPAPTPTSAPPRVEPARPAAAPAAAPAPTPAATPPAGAAPGQGDTRVGTGDALPGLVGGTGTGTGAGGSGGGGGVGLSMGGTPDGVVDSWYARQVEQRISGNWLRANLGGLTGRHEVVVQFEIAADGRLATVTVLKSTGPESFERSAIRAVRAADPLPPPPARYTMSGDRLRFVAVFEYPPK